jgi:thiol-disulfide isomerase/thioredoxin
MFEQIINFIQNNKNLVIAIIITIVISFVVYNFYFKKSIISSFDKTPIDNNYNESYNFSNDVKIINFNTSWCGYSKQFQPVWDEFTSKMNGKNIKVIDMKCDENEELCAKFNVPGYPSVILFKGEQQISYDGERTVKDLEEFVNKHL